MYISTYIYTYIFTHIYMYIYVFIKDASERPWLLHPHRLDQVGGLASLTPLVSSIATLGGRITGIDGAGGGGWMVGNKHRNWQRARLQRMKWQMRGLGVVAKEHVNAIPMNWLGHRHVELEDVIADFFEILTCSMC